MSQSLLRANGIPTTAECSRIKPLIKQKGDSILKIEKEIDSVRERVQISTQAVQNLELVVAVARNTLADYSKNHSALLNIQESLSELRSQWLLIPEPQDEPHSRETCNSFTNHTSSTVTSDLLVMEEQAKLTLDNAMGISSRLQQLENELDGWRFSLKFAEQDLKQLINQREEQRLLLQSAKDIFSPIRRVPAEVWAEVFQFHVDDALRIWLSADSNTIPTSTALKLSHVCRKWRGIIDGMASFWANIPGHSRSSWNGEKEDIFVKMIKMHKDSTLLIHLAHATTMNSQSLTAFRSRWGDKLFSAHTYSLIIKSEGHETNLKNFPLREPKSLTIHKILGQDGDLKAISYFSNVQKLTLVGHQKFTSRSIASSMTQLRYLFLELTTFTTFDLQPHLPSTLEELHIRHSGVNKCTLSTANVQLLTLTTLGVTPFEIELFKNINMPALRTLILYAPQSPPTVSLAESGAYASYFCGGVRNLELHSWPKIFTSNRKDTESWDSVTILEEIHKRIPILCKVTIYQSFIDGGRFIQLLSRNNSDFANRRKIEVILSGCDGITREECDQIASSDGGLVEKLTIFI